MPPKGLYCPDCRGVRLAVSHTRKPAPGVTVRYVRCSACGAHLKTVEQVVKVTKPGRKGKSRGDH